MEFGIEITDFTTGYAINRIPSERLSHFEPDMACKVTDKYCQSKLVTLLQVAQPIVRVFGLAIEQAEKP